MSEREGGVKYVVVGGGDVHVEGEVGFLGGVEEVDEAAAGADVGGEVEGEVA